MELRLNIDARKRVNLAKLLPDVEVHSVRAYTEGNKIILVPMAEVSADELSWLSKNPKALEAVKEGLKQSKEGKISLVDIDFSRFADEEI